jgi:hypothetical protein
LTVNPLPADHLRRPQPLDTSCLGWRPARSGSRESCGRHASRACELAPQSPCQRRNARTPCFNDAIMIFTVDGCKHALLA